MADLATLRPEVRRAFHRADHWKRGDRSWEIIRAELLHLQREEDRLHKVACKQLRRAQKAEAELAAIKVRIAEAPKGEVAGVTGKHSVQVYPIDVHSEPTNKMREMVGKRVRLVVENDDGRR